MIRARLSDAAFFYHEDLAKPIERCVEQLDTIVFQEKLGTLGDKVRRIERLAAAIARLVDASPEETAYAERAAHLAKADLVSHAVVEFTDLQGVMGGYYALAAGEEPGVAEAIVDHYRPRFAGDDLPALAGRQHRLDRRQARHDRRHLRGRRWLRPARPTRTRCAAAPSASCRCCSPGYRRTLDELIAAALAGYEGVLPFDLDRRRERPSRSSSSAGCRRSCATAATRTTPSTRCSRSPPTTPPTRSLAARRSRRSARRAPTWTTSRSRSRGPRTSPGPSWARRSTPRIMGPEELALADALDRPRPTLPSSPRRGRTRRCWRRFAGLRGPDRRVLRGRAGDGPDDPAERDNRLRLLNRFVALFGTFADFSLLAG